jgi:hypothetical protein
MRLTIICPEALRSDANSLAMVLGGSDADAMTYDSPLWRDLRGNTYAVASLEVPAEFISKATGVLVRPAWDNAGKINMEAARRAQELVNIWGLASAEEEEAGIVPSATPSNILALFNDRPLDVISRAGLVHVPTDSA